MPKFSLSGLLGALPGRRGKPGPQGEQFFLPEPGDIHFQGQNLI